MSPEDVATIKAKVDEATNDYMRKLVLITIIIYVALLSFCFLMMKAGGEVTEEIAEIMIRILLFPIFLMGDGNFG